jgi:hypothetical protein
MMEKQYADWVPVKELEEREKKVGKDREILEKRLEKCGDIAKEM